MQVDKTTQSTWHWQVSFNLFMRVSRGRHYRSRQEGSDNTPAQGQPDCQTYAVCPSLLRRSERAAHPPPPLRPHAFQTFLSFPFRLYAFFFFSQASSSLRTRSASSRFALILTSMRSRSRFGESWYARPCCSAAVDLAHVLSALLCDVRNGLTCGRSCCPR